MHSRQRGSLLSLALVSSVVSGCNSLPPLLPPIEYKVLDTKAPPPELLKPSVDPIDVGQAKPFKVQPFQFVEISSPQPDNTFGLINTVNKGPWSQTQNSHQILVDGKRLIDPQGDIVTKVLPIVKTKISRN